jgi:hypothetical protein
VGKLSLIVGVGGFVLLALWQISEAIIRRDKSTRFKSAAKAVLYLALAWSCLSFVRGAGSSSKTQTADVTAQIMDRPLGQALVAVVGAIILGIAIYHVYKGVKKRFLHDLREHPGTWAVRAGTFGYAAKGVALALVAGVFFAAAKNGNAAESTGLDGGAPQTPRVAGRTDPARRHRSRVCGIRGVFRRPRPLREGLVASPRARLTPKSAAPVRHPSVRRAYAVRRARR